ncbi:MAG: DUF4012 domain-containing protein [Actinomycetota bacterium]|nr:DUF4012 domain-containing protein [Actinomycetota bacterium]
MSREDHISPPDGSTASRRRWVLAGLFLVVLVWTGVSAVLLTSAALAARQGKVQLEQARDRFTADELVEGEGLVALEEAGSRFELAEERSGSPFLAPATVLPMLGRQVRSLHALAGAGAEVLQIAVEAAGDVEELRRGTREPAARVAAVEQLHGTVTAASRQLREVSLGPDEALVAPLADARQTIGDELAEVLTSLERGETVTAALVEVLRGSRYLVLAANNAEMQAGWGMPLSIGVLEVVDGDLVLDEMEATRDLILPADAVPVGGAFGATWGFMRPSQDFRNLALTASFEEAAPVAAAMWEELGRGSVDGVLALDPLALRAILETTGPVEVDGGPVGADDVVPLVLHDGYVLQAADPSGLDVRRERQSEIAVAAIKAASTPGTDLVELARNLAEAAESRHLMMWSADSEQQAAWEAAGVDGGLQPDSLLIGAVNRSPNKVDWFLDVAATATAQAGAGGIEVALEIELSNRTPDGEPEYVVGPFEGGTGPELSEGDWRGFLTVHLPGAAEGPVIEGLDLAVDGSSGPTRVVSAVVLIPKGQVTTHVVRFTLPPGAEVVVVEPSARVWPVQWAAGDETWWDDTGPRELDLSR